MTTASVTPALPFPSDLATRLAAMMDEIRPAAAVDARVSSPELQTLHLLHSAIAHAHSLAHLSWQLRRNAEDAQYVTEHAHRIADAEDDLDREAAAGLAAIASMVGVV